MSAVTSTLKYLKKFVLGLMILVLVWFLYGLSTRFLKSFSSAKKDVAQFNANDNVVYMPQVGTVQEISSDKTVDSILNGVYGPHVVMVYAEWCSHCKNMMDAFETAGKQSLKVPFIKIQGSNAPVTSAKHSINGYPTVLMSGSDGSNVKRFASARTPEALLEFASGGAPASGAPAAPASERQTIQGAITNYTHAKIITPQVVPQIQTQVVPQALQQAQVLPQAPLPQAPPQVWPSVPPKIELLN